MGQPDPRPTFSHCTKILLFAVVALILALTISSLWLFTPQDWGSVPAWGSTLSGFLAFAAVIYQQHRERKIRSEDAQIVQRMTERQQAEKIAAWAVQDEVKRGEVPIRISNTSDLPVYHMQIELSYAPYFPPGEMEKPDGRPLMSSKRFCLLVPPGGATVRIPVPEERAEFLGGVEITFTDTAGRKWIRDIFGNLEKASESGRLY